MEHQLLRVPEEEIRDRIMQLQQCLVDMQLDGALIVQMVDLYYFTGMTQLGHLYVPNNGDPVAYIRKSAARAKSETWIQVEAMGSMKTLQQELTAKFGSIARIGMEFDVLPFNTVRRYQQALTNIEVIDISNQIREIRMMKRPFEIEQLTKAAKIQDEAIRYALANVKEGFREIDLAAHIEFYIRTHGHLGVNRTRGFNQELVLGAVVSGPEAAYPSYFDGPAGGLGLSLAGSAGSGWSTIRKNEPILIDFCTCIEGYNIDQTRLAVWGELDSELEDAYKLSVEILRAIENLAKPGVTPEALYLKALEIVGERGLNNHFMGYGKDQARFLGHGVGLEVDELPVLAKGFQKPLSPGMTIAIEPKFTFPGKGVVGIENTYLVTDDSIRSLCITPEDILKIEV